MEKEPRYINVVMVPVDDEAFETKIENTLAAMQGIVNGFIEAVTINSDVVLVCNEEGKITEVPNRNVGADMIFGDFFICGVNKDEFTDISEKEAGKWINYFNRR